VSVLKCVQVFYYYRSECLVSYTTIIFNGDDCIHYTIDNSLVSWYLIGIIFNCW